MKHKEREEKKRDTQMGKRKNTVFCKRKKITHRSRTLVKLKF